MRENTACLEWRQDFKEVVWQWSKDSHQLALISNNAGQGHCLQHLVAGQSRKELQDRNQLQGSICVGVTRHVEKLC